MILSYHPCIEGDLNLLCAGRQPDDGDLAAIRDADAVILPQGCREPLYRMARRHNRLVFPNYDARFAYPGKTGQTRLFEALSVPRPRSWILRDSGGVETAADMAGEAHYPLVLKLDWGGEGETVFLLRSDADLARAMTTVRAYERSGHAGFVLQRFIPHANRSLRVAVIGRSLMAYWRVQDDPALFGTSVCRGARIDPDTDPHLIRRAVEATRRFCRQTGVNLAGFDFIFDESAAPAAAQPLFLEINYFFGRSGLGGSDRFFACLRSEIDGWLSAAGLAVGPPAGTAHREMP